MTRKSGFFFIVILFLIFSCTPQKKIVYLQGNVPASSNNDSADFILRIYPDDILTIQLYTVNPDAVPGLANTMDKQVIDNRTFYEKGLIVDKSGNVDIPLVGSIHIGDLSMMEAREKIVSSFRKYIDDPVIILKKLSFKITVLGEVTKPGLYYVNGEKISFLEALGLAGDLTNYADRREIKVFRKQGNETKEIDYDLTTTDVLSSQKKYLYPDDVIYIKPIRRKALANISPGVTVITSIITTTAIVLALILKDK